ncbi:5-bromo-4-chloroindolyl phosphate hydrolysis family protein [Ruminococcaceae bacterium OttesenSCG-928-L11]|nr:5-bromo-4-chloroindolyl phosphate hydrolysis family protein [Ruminococcaceae bacterium OttesenSCG-928-L11]
MKIKKLRYRSDSTSLMISILQIIAGGSFSAFFTLLYIIVRAVGSYSYAPPVASLVFVQGLFLAALLLLAGIRGCMLHSRYRRLATALFAKKGAVTIKSLCEDLGKNPDELFADIRNTLNRKYWSGYGMTDTTLVLVDSRNNAGTILSGPDFAFKESQRRSHTCIWFFASMWILYFIYPGLHNWYDYMVAAILSLVALLASAAILPKEIVLTRKDIQAIEYKPEPIKTGVEETDDLLKEGLAHYETLLGLDRVINDEKLDKPVRELVEITRQIFDYVKKSPEKSKQIRQFVKYYLPTTIKLLQNYDELIRQKVRGENINHALSKIEGVMDSILFTFRQQLDDLYRDKTIDITAEIEVMENMINQDDILSQ